jgi:hypothetical protein
MVSLQHLKTDDRIFTAYGTPIRNYTSRPFLTPVSINGILSEEYFIDRATNRWDGPAVLYYTTRMARIRSYVNCCINVLTYFQEH